MTAMRFVCVALLVCFFWLSGLVPASARTLGDALPDDCKHRTGDTAQSLEKRRVEIEAKIGDLRAKLSSAQEKRSRDLQRELRKRQEDLLEILFATDCLRLRGSIAIAPPAAPKAAFKIEADKSFERAMPRSRSLSGPQAPAPVAAPPPPVAVAAPPPPGSGPQPKLSPNADHVEVTAYYATNRQRNDKPTSPSDTFTDGTIGALTFGRISVSIPRSHVAGTIELPQLWKFERTPDPSKHFVLKSVTPMETDAARAELADRLKKSAERSMLIYVHGYNMGFKDAALRTAQLAYDLQFPGVAFFYTWPSANRIRGYLQDEETARLCESVFESVLDQLSQLPVEAVYIVAHSMGNRVVGHGLQAYVEKGKDTKHIKELLLAAPDVNADLFKHTIAPKLAQMRGTRTTIYASSSDLALMASKVVHGFRRVGESSGGVLVFNGLDTIDASNASPSVRNLGHSYLVDSTSVLKDLEAIIGRSLAASARGLRAMGVAPQSYWQLPQ